MSTVAVDPQAPARALAEAYIDLYPAEVAGLLEEGTAAEAVEFLAVQTPARACAVLERLPARLAGKCVAQMPAETLAALARSLHPGRAAVIFGQLPDEVRDERLGVLEAEVSREIREFMTYPADSAGHLMDTRFLTFGHRLTAREALARVREAGEKRVNNLIVVDEESRLLGVVPLAEVVLASPSAKLESLVAGRGVGVSALSSREEIVDLLTAGRLRLLPVLDAHERVIGVIRHEELMLAVQEDATADLSKMVGASTEERALSTPWFAVRKRLPWLNINLVTAFLAAAVVGAFEDTISRYTALAVLLPVVAGQSGNTGAQALAVVIRGLALREIRVADWMPVLTKEAIAGALNGVGIALVTALGVYVWSQSAGLCLVIGISMVVSMVIAGVSGAAIPVLLTALRQDPAQSGSIILTTVTDVMGFLSFLGLATMLSSML